MKNRSSVQSNSFILQKAASYQGPVSTKRFTFSSSFSKFKLDGLYCYPTLTYASTKTMNNHAIIPASDFWYVDCLDLTEKINEICSKSPFKTLEHTSPEITYSSVNTVEFGLERYDSEANRLNTTKKEIVKQVLHDIVKKEEIQTSECSVNLDVSDSAEPHSSLFDKRQSFDSLSSRSVFNASQSVNTVIPTNEEELVTCSKDSFVVELLPEYSSEFSFAKQSFDSSGIDEGSVNISTRLFLPKVLASKNLMDALPKEKDLEFFTGPENLSLLPSEIPEVISPILPKLLFCYPLSKFRALEIRSCVTSSGYLLSPTLEYSNLDSQSRGVIFYKSSKKLELFSVRVVRELSNKAVSWVSFGFEHSVLLTADGEVYSWGYGASGCLGHGSLLSCASPTLVSKLPRCVYLQCGAYHTAVLSECEELFTWGRGDVNQLGVANRLLLSDHLGYFAASPQRVEFFTGKRVKSVACGEAHTLVLDSQGTVYSFGWAEDGQLGLPASWLKDKYMSFGPKQIVYLKHKKISKISAGSIFSVALSTSGEVYVWGNGGQGQLGLGNQRKLSEIPTQVLDLQSEVILDLVCGEASVICLSEAGTLYGWGQGCAGIFESKGSQFPYGSDLVCYLPRKLCEIDISYRLVIN